MEKELISEICKLMMAFGITTVVLYFIFAVGKIINLLIDIKYKIK